MTKKIHIAMVGGTVENVIRGTRLLGCDELYPIVSKDFKQVVIDQLETSLKNDWIEIHRDLKDGTKLTIDPFAPDSYEKIIGLIIDIVQERRKEKDIEFWINITGGTNLMSAAAASGAMLTRSNAYYVVGKDDIKPRIIKLPWHSLVYKDLKPIRKAILIELVKVNKPLGNKDIEGKLRNMKKYRIDARKISYHLKILENRGYVKRTQKGRDVNNELTTWGKIAINLMKG